MKSTSLWSTPHLGAVPPAAYISSQDFKNAYIVLVCVYMHVDLCLFEGTWHHIDLLEARNHIPRSINVIADW